MTAFLRTPRLLTQDWLLRRPLQPTSLRTLSTSTSRCYQSPERGSEEMAGVDTDELANTDSAFSPNNPPGRNVENVEKETGKSQSGFTGAQNESTKPPSSSHEPEGASRHNVDEGAKTTDKRRSGGAD